MASLRDLGLSEYEARSYRSLLRTGPATAKELSRTSEVPMGRVYDVLNDLEREDLVRSQTASRPKKYAPVEPEAALDRLLEERKRELRERERQFGAAVEELTEELESADPVDDQFWTAAVGTEETIDLLSERIAAAERSIVMIAGSSPAGFDISEVSDRMVESIAAALDRGVDVKVLLAPDAPRQLPPSVTERYDRRLADREGFSVRTNERVDGTFNVFDDVEVCIEVQNPLDPDEPFALIDLKDSEFAADVTEAFETTWEDARPLSLE